MNASEDFQRSGNGWQDAVIIIPALLSASTLLSVAVMLWKLIQNNRMKGREVGEWTADNPEDGWAVNEAGVFENPLGAPDPVLEKSQLPEEWRIVDRKVLCRGHYGPISWAALVRSGEERRDVVLKELSRSCSLGEVQDFSDLLRFYLHVCTHDGLVRALWCQTDRRPVCLITEAMTLGNLLLFLREMHQGGVITAQGDACGITERDVYSMALQVASGLQYLNVTHRLVHGYVAACNVLLHQDLSVRLCGLGLAAIQHRTGSIPASRANRVPVKWQSPERLREAAVTESSDVWSFGILLYEMVTLGAPPYPDLEPAQLARTLQKRHTMKRPQQCGERLYEMMASCWQWEALRRPDFTDLLTQLQSGRNEADGSTLLTECDTLNWPDYLDVAGIPS